MALISRWNCRNVAIWLMACCMLAGCADKRPDESPTGVVRQFYTLRINSQLAGAPTAAELEGMRPLLSRELQDLLQRISRQSPEDRPKTQGKPSFIDGDLFSSISAGPTSFTTGRVEQHAADEHVIPVRFVSARQLPAINWVDRVKVINENGHYVLADIEYANHWQLGGKGTLVKELKKAARS